MVLKTRWSNKIMDQFMHLQPKISLQGLYVLKPTRCPPLTQIGRAYMDYQISL